MRFPIMEMDRRRHTEDQAFQLPSFGRRLTDSSCGAGPVSCLQVTPVPDSLNRALALTITRIIL